MTQTETAAPETVSIEVDCDKCGNRNRVLRRACKHCQGTGKVAKNFPAGTVLQPQQTPTRAAKKLAPLATGPYKPRPVAGWKKPPTRQERSGEYVKSNWPTIVRGLNLTARRATPNADARRAAEAQKQAER